VPAESHRGCRQPRPGIDTIFTVRLAGVRRGSFAIDYHELTVSSLWPFASIRECARNLEVCEQAGAESVVGGRHWTRTSDLLHVKRFRLSAVLGAWECRARLA